MIHLLRPHEHPIDLMATFAQIFIGDSRGQLIEFHGEVMMLHLTRQYIAQRKMRALWAIDSEVIARLKQRREERETLDVIPVRVGEQDGGRDRPRCAGRQTVAQCPSSRAAVQHQDAAGWSGQLDT